MEKVDEGDTYAQVGVNGATTSYRMNYYNHCYCVVCWISS